VVEHEHAVRRVDELIVLANREVDDALERRCRRVVDVERRRQVEVERLDRALDVATRYGRESSSETWRDLREGLDVFVEPFSPSLMWVAWNAHPLSAAPRRE